MDFQAARRVLSLPRLTRIKLDSNILMLVQLGSSTLCGRHQNADLRQLGPGQSYYPRPGGVVAMMSHDYLKVTEDANGSRNVESLE